MGRILVLPTSVKKVTAASRAGVQLLARPADHGEQDVIGCNHDEDRRIEGAVGVQFHRMREKDHHQR